MDELHTTLINELVGNDGQMAATLRAVYESGQQESFLGSLNNYVVNSDAEIEKMCNFHYQEFITAINELLLVRQQGAHLRKELVDINGGLQETGSKQLILSNELRNHRVMLKNIATSIEALDACLPVLKTYGKVMEHFNAKRYYQALRALGQMDVFLPKVEGLSIYDLIQNSIPDVRDAIKNAVRSDLQDWMEEVMTSKSREIGEVVLENTRKNQIEKSNSMFRDYYSEDLRISHIVDFTPVYRCLHVYSVLGVRHEVDSFYIDARRKQANLILDSNMNALGSSPNQRVNGLFAKVLGFFIVEDTVLNTTENLISRETVDELWKLALDKIVHSVVQSELDRCKDKSQLLELKQTIEIFCLALSSYQLSVKRMYSLFANVKERFDYILMHESHLLFNSIIEKVGSDMMVIETEGSWNSLIAPLMLQDTQLSNGAFPRKMPFSILIPKVFAAVKSFLDSSMQFSDELQIMDHSNTNKYTQSIEKLISSQLLPSANSFMDKHIVKTLSSCQVGLQEFMESLTHTVVFAATIRCLPQLSYGIYCYIDKKTSFHRDKEGTDRKVELSNSSIKAFSEIRKYADSSMTKLLKGIVDNFLRKASYNWCPEEEDSMPSQHVNEMVTYMSTTFHSFDNLPKNISNEAYTSACKLMADRLLSLVTELQPGMTQRDKPPTRMTTKIFPKLEMDVVLCEGFGDSCEVSGSSLRNCFKEIRQLVQLIVSQRFDEYLNRNSRAARYDSLQPHNLIAVLERLCVDDGLSGGFSRFFGGDNSKKVFENVLSQLR